MGNTFQETMNVSFYTTVSVLESDWVSSLPRLLVFSLKHWDISLFVSLCLSVFVLMDYHQVSAGYIITVVDAGATREFWQTSKDPQDDLNIFKVTDITDF